MKSERREEIVEVWKTIVEVQKHFNDIEMRIRSLFITMVLAVAAAQGFLMDKGLSIKFGDTKILYATFIPLLGVIATFLFYFMDRYWYHRLLIGAVKHGIKIEEKYAAEMPELGLSASIGEASPIKLKRWITRLLATLFVQDAKFIETGELHSDGKIELFYKPVVTLFVCVFFLTVLFGGVIIDGSSLAKAIITCLI